MVTISRKLQRQLRDYTPPLSDKRKDVGSGDTSVDATVQRMIFLTKRDALDERVIAVARELSGKNNMQTAKNIFHYVVDNYPYLPDPDDREHITAPIHLLTDCSATGESCKYRDCDDLSMLYNTLCEAAGLPTAFRVIAWRMKLYTHVYSLVYLPDRNIVIPIDPVMQKKGFANEKDVIIRRKDYPVSSRFPNIINH